MINIWHTSPVEIRTKPIVKHHHARVYPVPHTHEAVSFTIQKILAPKVYHEYCSILSHKNFQIYNKDIFNHV